MIELGLFIRAAAPRTGQTECRLSTSTRLVRTGDLLVLSLDDLEPGALHRLAHSVAAGDKEAAVVLAAVFRVVAAGVNQQLERAADAGPEALLAGRDSANRRSLSLDGFRPRSDESSCVGTNPAQHQGEKV